MIKPPVWPGEDEEEKNMRDRDDHVAALCERIADLENDHRMQQDGIVRLLDRIAELEEAVKNHRRRAKRRGAPFAPEDVTLWKVLGPDDAS